MLRRSAAIPQRQQQPRFEADMGEFVGDDGPAEQLQTPAVRCRFKRAIVNLPDQLGADEYA